MATPCLSAAIPAQGSRSHPGKMVTGRLEDQVAWVASVSPFRQSPTMPLGGGIWQEMQATVLSHGGYQQGWRELAAKGGGQNRQPRGGPEAHRLLCQPLSLQTPLTNRTLHRRPFPRPDAASAHLSRGPARQEAPGMSLSIALSP